MHLEVSPGHHCNFIHCMRTRKLTICNITVVCRSVTACYLVNIAYWTGRSVCWNHAVTCLDGPRCVSCEAPLA